MHPFTEVGGVSIMNSNVPSPTRRSAVLSIALCGVVLTVGACTDAAGRAAAPTPNTASALPTSAVSPPAGVASRAGDGASGRGASSAGGRTTIPRHWTLQPADLYGAIPTTAEADHAALRHVLPPQPCGPDFRYPSSARRTAAHAITATLGYDTESGAPAPSVVTEYIAVYRDGGAQAFLTELREALRRCAQPDGAQEHAWKIIDTGVAGGDSLLVKVTSDATMGGGKETKNAYVGVARTGDTVVAVADLGWEASDGHEKEVREWVKIAKLRAETDN